MPKVKGGRGVAVAGLRPGRNGYDGMSSLDQITASGGGGTVVMECSALIRSKSTSWLGTWVALQDVTTEGRWKNVIDLALKALQLQCEPIG